MLVSRRRPRLAAGYPATYNERRRYLMTDDTIARLLVFGAFIAWFVLMRFVLPRMGVST
jgi:hypothetical protein